MSLDDTLKALAAGTLSVADAKAAIGEAAMEDIGFARVDHHRALRHGIPEVILGAGKTPSEIAAIAERIAARSGHVLVTRADADAACAVQDRLPDAQYHEKARCVALGGAPAVAGTVAVVSAGTSDAFVAEEASVCAAFFGLSVAAEADVGVAGIHRILRIQDRIAAADVVVVVAGMDGALVSVVGGMTDKPVIAVPTSVGYGATFGGVSALLAMLTSCAAGISVVNIDNGYGAARAAFRILRGRI